MAAVLPISKGLRAGTLCDNCHDASTRLTLTIDFHTVHLCMSCAYGISKDLIKMCEKIATENIAVWIESDGKQ
jgi:hypothetical protein